MVETILSIFCFQSLQKTKWPFSKPGSSWYDVKNDDSFPKMRQKGWIGHYHARTLEHHMVNRVLYWGSWPWRLTLKEVKRSCLATKSSKSILKCSPTLRRDSYLWRIKTQNNISKYAQNSRLASNSLIAKSNNAKNTFSLQWSKTSWKLCSSVSFSLKEAWIFSGTCQRIGSLGYWNSRK